MGSLSTAQQGHLALLVFSALVAGSFALGVMAANHIAPTALTAVRFWLAAMVIGIAALATTGLPRETARAPWRYVVLGGLFGGYFVLMFEGLKTAPAINAAAVFTLTPVLSGIFGYLLLRQITTRYMATALAIGAAGALWVVFRGDPAALLAFEVGQGEVIYFFGIILHAVYIPMARKLHRGEPAVAFTFGLLLAGAVVLTLYGWADLRATNWADLPPIVWITLAYLAVFSSAVSFWLLQIGTLRLPAAKVMAYTYLTPSWVILWEIALGRSAPPLIVLVGIALSAVALLLLLRDR